MTAQTAAQAAAVRVREPATLELRDVRKRYGGLRAVDGVSAAAEPGRVLGIAGPNGAGKTTLFDVVSGLTAPTAGDVLLGGRSLTGISAHRRCHVGMARTFQQPTVTTGLTVRENLVVASRFGRAREHWEGVGDDVDAHVGWALRWGGLDGRAADPAALLGVFDRKRLMLAAAMAVGPRVLLLDEPFGGLNAEEIDAMLALVRSAAELGVAVVCIEHVMRALVQLADRVLVMHRGGVLFEGSPSAMLADRRVIETYLGSAQARGGEGRG